MRQPNFDLKCLQERHRFVTRRDPSYALARAADMPHELGLKQLRAGGLRRKQVDALAREWQRRDCPTARSLTAWRTCEVPEAAGGVGAAPGRGDQVRGVVRAPGRLGRA